MWRCEKGVIFDMCELLGKDFNTFLTRVKKVLKRCDFFNCWERPLGKDKIRYLVGNFVKNSVSRSFLS